jgi:hypothetical protein
MARSMADCPENAAMTFVISPVFPNRTMIMNAATIPGRLFGNERIVRITDSPGSSYFARAWATGTAIAIDVIVVAKANQSVLNATVR